MKLINLFLITFLIGSVSILAQTSAFTYQGSLNDNSTQANGTYQMRFSLFDQNIGGAQIGSAVEITNVQVEDGIFTVKLDFGTDPFSFGSLRYLQVEVRRNSGETYTPLAPRQQVTTTPYSIRTIIANAAENAYRLGNVDANQFVQTNDPRLSDARTPTAGSGNYIQNTTIQQSANFNVSGTGTANEFNALTDYKINGLTALKSSVQSGNTLLGPRAGLSLTTGYDNTLIGNDAGREITSGFFNSFEGSFSGYSQTTGHSNVYFGYKSGYENTTGYQNTFLGSFSGFDNTTGQNNTFIGMNSGDLNVSGSNNSTLGKSANLTSGNLNFATAIGADAVVSTSSTVQLGRSSDRTNVSGTLNVLNGRTSFNERGNVNLYSNSGDLNLYMQGGNSGDGIVLKTETPGVGNSHFFISHFNGNTYEHRLVVKPDGRIEIRVLGTGGNEQLCRNSSTNAISTCSSSMRYKSNVENFSYGLNIIKKLRPVSFNWTEGGMLDFGLVAEEVAEIEPLLTTQNADGKTEGVKYDRVGVVLVNAVQEQQKQIEDQQTEIKKQEEIIKQQQTEIELLKKQQKEFAALKALVCANNREAELCKTENQITAKTPEPAVKENK